MENELEKLAYIALPGLTIFPGITTVLDVNTDRSKKALLYANTDKDRRVVFLVYKDEVSGTDLQISDYYRYGMTARITNTQTLPNGNVRVTAEGLERVVLKTLEENFAQFEVSQIEMFPGDDLEPYRATVLRELLEEKIIEISGRIVKNPGMVQVLKNMANQPLTPTGVLMNAVVAKLSLKPEKRYLFIAKTGFEERMVYLIALIEDEIKSIDVKNEIQEKVRLRVDKNQRDYLLREEMKSIQDELGDGAGAQTKELLKKAHELDATSEVINRLEKDINKLSAIPFGVQEGIVLKNYVETLLEMPWNKATEDNNDIAHAEEILERDHYGLKKVKDRVLEYLAVRNLNGGNESAIMCLVGPPGTGKTSIARSIAEALGRKYVRVSLGGVHDEAEIRGHRKTYVGAMPGRIANAIKQAGVANPVVLLDELDKLGADHRGDPASALLEVLDSEQNVSFRDHFIELPIDLSRVIFIATANDAGGIPGPLRDRVEMIEVSSYTANEKLHIAEKYLVGKQLKKHGLCETDLQISTEAVKEIIKSYTKEAGVRELERKIGQICRKMARFMVEGSKNSDVVTPENLKEYLGKIRYRDDERELIPQIGIVNGLAWTSVGGDILEIEVNVLDGKGAIVLTGKLGDVMKESAQTALSFVRSLGLCDADYFEKHDLHIHVPEGAVPKDGPSAGITLATAIYSALTSRAVRGDVAMTGEVTLRGRVLPIGGLKEKLLAANAAGMREVFVPAINEADVDELSKEIIGDMKIVFVSHMSQVLEGALV